MLEQNNIYFIENDELGMTSSHRKYSLAELTSVSLQTQSLSAVIKSPILKVLYHGGRLLMNQENELVDIYLALEYETGQSESIRLTKRALPDASQGYFDILRQGIALKKDLETYIED